MHSRLRLALAAGALSASALLWAACGLDASGLLGVDAGQPDGTVEAGPDGPDLDAELDVAVDTYVPPPCSTLDASCLPPYDQDAWVPIALAAKPNNPCPDPPDGSDAGFNTLDYIANPKAQAGACLCGCTNAGSPNCGGNVTVATSDAGNCSNAATTTMAANAGCVAFGIPADPDAGLDGGGSVKVTAPPMDGVTCNTSRTGDAGWTATRVRACEPASCDTDFCGLKGYTLCIAHLDPTDGGCPSGFKPHAAYGAGAGVNCPNCAGCTLTNAKCSGALVGSDMSDCSGNPDFTAPGNGVTCTPFSGATQAVYWDAGPLPSVGCDMNAQSLGLAKLAGTFTVCCQP